MSETAVAPRPVDVAPPPVEGAAVTPGPGAGLLEQVVTPPAAEPTGPAETVPQPPSQEASDTTVPATEVQPQSPEAEAALAEAEERPTPETAAVVRSYQETARALGVDAFRELMMIVVGDSAGSIVARSERMRDKATASGNNELLRLGYDMPISVLQQDVAQLTGHLQQLLQYGDRIPAARLSEVKSKLAGQRAKLVQLERERRASPVADLPNQAEAFAAVFGATPAEAQNPVGYLQERIGDAIHNDTSRHELIDRLQVIDPAFAESVDSIISGHNRKEAMKKGGKMVKKAAIFSALLLALSAWVASKTVNPRGGGGH